MLLQRRAVSRRPAAQQSSIGFQPVVERVRSTRICPSAKEDKQEADATLAARRFGSSRRAAK